MNDAVVTPADVLRFWLGAYPLDAAAMQRVQAQWFRKNEAFDAELRHRFGPTLAAALAGQLNAWANNADGWLALLVVLDQFTRNAFRGQPGSFAGDARALAVAQAGIARGDDQHLPPLARIFCYLPLEHAENADDQARSVALFTALRDAPDALPKPFFDGTLDYARKHQDVIRRFGRFPHRNAILGRASTADERAYLAQPGAGF
ncbi:DUF924 family protein [Ottowia testudinis]|uniref:DUF924 domain-containing protein n=1 Tax=Ottowia testudinis TaxID=2816950 RepID=A0A975H4B5_9BURK|nr:DUF924 family protein [Ottowia testudinis]QTD46684.1 DUF924 domain-containing protein [Ottowia testudinis]